MRRTIWTLLIFLGFTLGLQAQDVTIAAKVDSNRYLIGQWITVHLSVDAPSKYTLHLPASDDDIDNGEFVSADEPKEELSGERRQYRQDVVATVFDTGSIALRIRVQYSVPGDTATYSVFTPAIALEITTVALDTAQTFKDIKDVLNISLTIWDYLLYAAALLLLVLLGWFGYRWYQKRLAVEDAVEIEEVPGLPPDVEALQALSELKEKKLWQSGEHKTYQSRVTDILRFYIERRYRIPAMEQPTSEIIPGLAMLGLSPHTVERVEQVLRTADLTKFAKYLPSSMQHEDAMAVSVQFVETTKPLAATVIPGAEKDQANSSAVSESATVQTRPQASPPSAVSSETDSSVKSSGSEDDEEGGRDV